nr:retrovirus-related Pol polyprotein from transposon TNT 1-94 [Tanacetum cinerariifolium]
MTLIEVAKTMLADSFLPNTFWVEAVSIACYVLNRVLVTKPQNKTPYEHLTGKLPIISYIRPFGCHVTSLNTIDHLGKFEEKFNEGFLVGYSLNSKAFRVYNLETKRIKENLHINFLENKLNVAGKGPTWLFDLDYLTDSINYQLITIENKANKTAGSKETNNSAVTQDSFDAGNYKIEADHAQEYYVLPLWSFFSSTVKSLKAKDGDEKLNEDTDSKTNKEPVDHKDQAFLDELKRIKRQEKEANDAVETLRKMFAQSTKDLLLQAGAARASSTNHKAIRTKGVYKNKKDERGVVVRNKARIEAIRIFLAFASYMGFIVYQMDVKNAFLYGKIDDKVYVSQPPGFIDAKLQKKKSWCDEFKTLMKNRFQMSCMGELTFFLALQVKQKEDGIFISQDKYVAEILKKFDFLSVKTASTSIETKKPLVKDEKAADVDVYPYRSMINSLMYLTASGPDIMYLKDQLKLGLWYPRDSAFDLEAYSDSDYTGANLNRKSTT